MYKTLYVSDAQDCTGNIHHVDDSIQLECGTIEKVKSFCYLGDILQCEGGAKRAVRDKSFSSLVEVERSHLCQATVLSQSQEGQ